MTTDLWMLMAATGLFWALIMTDATISLAKKGLLWGMGNRDDAPPPSPPHARLKRAVANFAENLPIFAIVVLVAHVTGAPNDTSALGSMIFVGGRVAHAVLYVAGVTMLRTVAWGISIVGMVMVAIPILS